jgi:hypothetical protein
MIARACTAIFGVAVLTASKVALATSRCPPGTEAHPDFGLALALLGAVLSVWLVWGGVLGARLGPRWGRLPRVLLDVTSAFLSLAAGAAGFAYFAMRCSPR